METKTQTDITWKIPEYREYERSKKWYMISAAISAALIMYAVVTSNFLFAMIIIIAIITIALHDNKKAAALDFSITENGIRIGEAFYDYSLFKNFWIYYEPSEAKTLFFEFKNSLRPRLSVPLQNKNPLKIRAILLAHMTENIQMENEPLSEQISRIIKI